MQPMNTTDAIRHMISQSGKTLRSVSIESDRAPTFLSTTLGKTSKAARADTLAKVARICGYRLVLVGRGEEVEVDE